MRTKERVRLIHGKGAIGVRAIEVLLYFEMFYTVITLSIGRHWPDQTLKIQIIHGI